MDVLFKPVGHIERNFPTRIQPLFLCDTPAKRDYVDSKFAHCFFGVVYQGTGSFEVDGVSYKIDRPSVITQWAGPHFRYGPDTAWAEIYIRFSPSCFSELTEYGLWSPDRPCYPIEDLESWRIIHQLLRNELARTSEEFDIGALDRLVELLIIKSLPTRNGPSVVGPQSGASNEIREIQKNIQNNLTQDYDWNALASKLGMSTSTFRRQWLSLVGLPPARYLTQQRLERGSGLLLATALSIQEIAYAVGFEDPLHFSRKFKQYYKVSPKSYRTRNRR